MYSLLKHLHSGFRWAVLITVIWAIADSYRKWKANQVIGNNNRKPAFFAFLFCHLQLLGGLILYFISPRVLPGAGMMKDPIMRFFGMEHPLMMLIAVALLTIGYIKGKKSGSFKFIFWYYLIALIIFLVMIPWPFMKYQASWF